MPYDGRYDQYIMTDSEEEYEVDEYHRVGFAAEVACILVIGCVTGLKGLSKMRRGVREPIGTTLGWGVFGLLNRYNPMGSNIVQLFIWNENSVY